MKPAVEVILSGLDADQLFDIILEFVLIGNDKYTVINGEWAVKKNAAEPFNGGNLIKLFSIIFRWTLRGVIFKIQPLKEPVNF